jgi:hypothetical protein
METKLINGLQNNFFDESEIKKAKSKAQIIVTEIKKFISAMGFIDWILLVLVLTFGLSTITNLFGINGNIFTGTGKKIIKNLKDVGFWRAMGLLSLVVFATDRAIKVVDKYKMNFNMDETKRKEN